MKLLFLFVLAFSFNAVSQIVDAGNGHALLLDENHKLWTVGRNDHGQLGVGNYMNSAVPVEIPLTNIVDIARGYDHSMAIGQDGVVWVWGNNRFGQLGISNENQDVLEPVDFDLKFKVKRCEGGYDHSLFLDTKGKVWAVGFNENGELGNLNNSNSVRVQPVLERDGMQLTGISTIVSVGSHSLALDSNGFVYGWGANHYGELGHFNVSEQNYAEKIEGLSSIVSIAAGWGHSLALDNEGDVYAWGAKPETYEITGSGKKTMFYKEIERIEGLENVEEIACGSWHSMAIDHKGQVWTWGWNSYGMLGNGSMEHSSIPVKMYGVENACSIGGGCFQSLVIDSAGSFYSCGDNIFGQLGLGHETRTLVVGEIQFNDQNKAGETLLLYAIIAFVILIFGIKFLLGITSSSK